MDKIKSIAIPVTRKGMGKKARPAGHPTPPQYSEVGGRVGPLRKQPHAVLAGPIHRYAVGQRLTVLSGGRSWARAQTMCRVVAQLPYESGALRYRIRSELENFERVVDEIDLVVP